MADASAAGGRGGFSRGFGRGGAGGGGERAPSNYIIHSSLFSLLSLSHTHTHTFIYLYFCCFFDFCYSPLSLFFFSLY